MLKKKSQITLFMILGIVILTAFLFLYYISSLIQPEQNLVSSTQNIVKSSLLESYVTKCLQRTAIDGLILLGNQGGKIYLDNNDNTMNYLGKKILIGIPNKPLPNGLEIPFPFQQQTILFPYFGRDRISQLCDSDGPNSRNELFQSCLSYTRINSIQEQLNVYIENKIEDCTQLDNLFSNVKYNLPKSEVIIGENDIQFNLIYPINYTLESQKFQLNHFNYDLNVRIKHFHEFIKAVVKKEVSYPQYKINEDYVNELEYEPEFQVELIKNVLSNTDLVKFTDFGSILDGHAYSFRFLIENRAPVILDIDLSVLHNRVEIQPIIADPDDDDVIISIDNSYFQRLDGRFYMQPILLNPGNYLNKITVIDSRGLESEQEISFDIN